MSAEHDIRRKVIFVKNVKRILASLKMIAAVKSKKLSLQNIHAKTFYHNNMNNINSPFLTNINATQTLNIVLGASKGLCGNFILNLNLLFKKHFKNIEDDQKWVLLGNKFPNWTQNIPSENILVKDELSQLDTKLITLAEYIYDKKDEFKEINIIAWQTAGLDPQIHNIFAIEEEQVSNLSNDLQITTKHEYKMINIFRLFSILNHFITASLTREEKNRLFAMDQAITNSDDMLKDLQRQFNQVRQSAITNEINEIISGCEYV